MSYESDKLLSEYLLMHYGTDAQLMPWDFGPKDAIGFPTRTVSHFSEGSCDRALDLGCAVGRSAFELSRNAQEVIGIDFSANFIAAAEHLRTEGNIDYTMQETGKTAVPATASLQTLPDDIQPENCRFLQGDAMNLPAELGSFDRVHAANLICRLPHPEKTLQRFSELVKPGGELVLATPCTWLDEYTPADQQPEGDTFEWLKDQLSESFELKKQTNEPFLIRETARKYQWTVSMVTVWNRI
ncbi:putative 4-mercaptohistidine N1-methyltransferase [Akkermansiaceae bacterium]|nr:putative 4-mercaptohistidine N1-methyltransferase [Akkermansiaceae bacterium]